MFFNFSFLNRLHDRIPFKCYREQLMYRPWRTASINNLSKRSSVSQHLLKQPFIPLIMDTQNTIYSVNCTAKEACQQELITLLSTFSLLMLVSTLIGLRQSSMHRRWGTSFSQRMALASWGPPCKSMKVSSTSNLRTPMDSIGRYWLLQ